MEKLQYEAPNATVYPNEPDVIAVSGGVDLPFHPWE